MAMKDFLVRVRASRLCRFAGWASLLVFPLFCWFILEYYNFGSLTYLITFLRTRRLPALFGWLICYLAFLLALLLFRRAAAACGVVGALSLVIAYVNYMKLALNGDHFFPKDLLMVNQAGSLLSFISGDFPKWMPCVLLVLVVWCAALAVLGLKLSLSRAFRLCSAASLVALCAVFCADSPRVVTCLNRFSLLMESTALQDGNYFDNGFVGAFALNLQSLRVQPPDGYSEAYVRQLLDGYEGRAAEEEPFDVILVLSESFFDLRELPGLTFSQDPLTHYDELLQRENCYSGRLYTNAIGGGTVRPEFEILTGLDTEALPTGATPYEYVNRPLESYVSNYKDAGYQAVALHPYIASFYARKSAYPNLGFDHFYSKPEIEQMGELDYKRGYVTDESLERVMESLLDSAEEPMFLFAITMQNHQPFSPLPEEELAVTVSSDLLSEDNLAAVATYTQGLYDADRMLGRLAEYVDGRERPTVLIFFGDHKATLGQNFGAYVESGLFPLEENYFREYREIMYSTPFLVYSNRELKPGLFTGNRDNQMSSYYLLDAVALSTGFQTTPYMELLADFYQTVPYYNVRLSITRTPEIVRTVQARQAITYDRMLGKGYTVKGNQK